MVNDELLKRIGVLFENERYSHARPLLEQAFAQDPEHPRVLYYAARMARHEANYPEMLRFAERAVYHDPSFRDAKVNIFLARFYMRQLREAELAILDVIKDNPADGDAMALYAILLTFSDDHEKARAVAEDAYRHEPTSTTSQIARYLVTDLFNEKEASDLIQELVKKDPSSFSILYFVGTDFVKKGRYKEAYEIFQQLLRSDPTDKDVLINLANLKAMRHPVCLPFYPLFRWGWFFSGAMFSVVVPTVYVMIRILDWFTVGLTLLCAYISYVFLSWFVPSLMRNYYSNLAER